MINLGIFIKCEDQIPSFALAILSWLWQNTLMPRWIPILISLALGIALGLAYGWIISPVEYTDITPEALRVDYQTDYVLMVAEAYHVEQDPELAAKRLAIFGSKPPAVIVGEAYIFAGQSAYLPEDLTLIQDLEIGLQTWQPILGTNLP